LVIFTAQLLGAEFQKQGPVKTIWVASDGVSFGYSRFACAQDWLWKNRGMRVRKDGSIYQDPMLLEIGNPTE
jgi:hypothetical protein